MSAYCAFDIVCCYIYSPLSIFLYIYYNKL
nr:MAG TPA: hypothetical protein [Caudoviricetes sp.]